MSHFLIAGDKYLLMINWVGSRQTDSFPRDARKFNGPCKVSIISAVKKSMKKVTKANSVIYKSATISSRCIDS